MNTNPSSKSIVWDPPSNGTSIALGPEGTLAGGFDASARWNAASCADPLTGVRNPVEGFVVGGALTAELVEAGTADNAPTDGTGAVVQFDVEAVKTR